MFAPRNSSYIAAEGKKEKQFWQNLYKRKEDGKIRGVSIQWVIDTVHT